MNSVSDSFILMKEGFPIRKLAGRSSLAAHRDFSQLTTSFVDCWCQGIHRMPFVACYFTCVKFIFLQTTKGSTFVYPYALHLQLHFGDVPILYLPMYFFSNLSVLSSLVLSITSINIFGDIYDSLIIFYIAQNKFALPSVKLFA